MNNFTVIYKILSALEKSMDFENFDSEQISPEKLGITKERRDKLLIEMQREGYITGISVKKWISSPAHIEEPISPNITIKRSLSGSLMMNLISLQNLQRAVHLKNTLLKCR